MIDPRAKRLHAPHQTTTPDPDRAVAVLEAHLGERLAVWQVAAVIAVLTPRALWAQVEPPAQGRPVVRRTYGTCVACGWTGKITAAGGVRKHKNPGGGSCPGSGERTA